MKELTFKACLGGHKMSRSPHLPTRILKVHMEAFTGFNHIHSLDGLNNTYLSQGCVLEDGSYCTNSGQSRHSKNRGGDGETPIAWGSLSGQLEITPLDDLSNK